VLRAIKHLMSVGKKAIDCKSEEFESYNRYIDQGNTTKAWAVATTSSWYKNKTGRAAQTWPFGLLEYWNLTAKFSPEPYHFH